MKSLNTFEDSPDTGSVNEVDEEREPHERRYNSQGSKPAPYGTLIYRSAHDCVRKIKIKHRANDVYAAKLVPVLNGIEHVSSEID